ncbi:MAG TPA: RNA-binding S4 domain-containing protein [Beijerinckiaceae bacterium]|nr:RNA-binding S4 domain-containing protein [Beijerinckiaceae bacterium]
MTEGPVERQRLDKWLWHARFGRTRTRSAEIVRSGHVRVNGARITDPGKGIKAGDVLTLAMPGRTLVIRVVAFAGKRGDSPTAQALYEPVAD